MPIDLQPHDAFVRRHIGPGPHDLEQMLAVVDAQSLDQFIDTVVPSSIRTSRPLQLGPVRTEQELLEEAASLAGRNAGYRSVIGMGYCETFTPPVILRNILENPGWYTAYTPYQAEIAQGRLEALLNFQTMIIDMTGMEIANASLLDEATAAAEAMSMFYAVKGHPAGGIFFVSAECHPQTIAVVQTRATPLGISVVVGDHRTFRFTSGVFGVLLQYPASDGAIV